MVYFIPDESLWGKVKASAKPIKFKVKGDVPKRLRVVRSFAKTPSTILDLHGLTVQTAFETTQKFIERARSAGLTEITIITGRGTMGNALIKNEFDGWLDHPKFKPHVRTYAWKNKGGAVKIALKKKSN